MVQAGKGLVAGAACVRAGPGMHGLEMARENRLAGKALAATRAAYRMWYCVSTLMSPHNRVAIKCLVAHAADVWSFARVD